jgi:serine protease Do
MILPGNSGGPLVNLAGEIVGVNEIGLGGLAGAIPGDLVKTVFNAIKRDGRVRRSWTGIEVQPRVSALAAPGALISWVTAKSPADTAGVKTGDVLLKVNDTLVDAKIAEQLPTVNQTLFGLAIGQPARLLVRRDTREFTVSVTPIERSEASSQPVEMRPWGMVISNISRSEALEMGRTGTDGVLVMNLRPGGPAEQARPALARNDVIVELDGQPIRSQADLEARTLAALDSKSKASFLVAFDRGLERRLTIVDVGQAAVGDSGAEASKAWVPVSVQVLTPTLADRLGLKGRTGVRVTRVVNADVPLKVGDVILAIDGDAVRASAPNDEEVFAASIRRFRIGATVTLTVNRAGSEMAIPVVLATSPKLAREMTSYEDANFDFRVRNTAASDKDDPRLAGQAVGGAFVESVSQGSWAAVARLAVGDIILAVDGHAIGNVDDLAAQMKDIAARRPASVVLNVRRGIRTLFVEIKPSWR